MNLMRRWMVTAVILLAASMALVAPSGAATGTLHAPARNAAAHPTAPFPSCGDHFQLTRSGSNVRIVGVGLNAFSRGYMLVYVSAHGRSYGPYNASPYGGANFTINTGSSSRTTIAISLTNDTNTATLCSSDYNA
jgi:hypothetical protein